MQSTAARMCGHEVVMVMCGSHKAREDPGNKAVIIKRESCLVS